MVGNYAHDKEIEFEIVNFENKNIDEIDIIFGEFYDLSKFKLEEFNQPSLIKNFYQNNRIENKNNLFPLDLDTLVIVTKEHNKIDNLEDLSNYYNRNSYTLGISFAPRENFLKYLYFNFNIDKETDMNDTLLMSYKRLFKNINKNIIKSKFIEIYESYEDHENSFTSFSDGILLYENLKYNDFQLFPKSKYQWSEKNGAFIKNENFEPISFFGFSALLTNQDHFGLICYLLEENNRINTFLNFNLEISPLSLEEVKSIENKIPDKYKSILKNKNKNIKYIEQTDFYDKFMSIVFNEKQYSEVFTYKSYLNSN